MNDPRIVHVKQFTPRASLPAVAFHAGLIAFLCMSMVMSLPSLG